VAGTVALVLFDERLITEPPEGAAVDKVTVPVTDAPPITEDGVTDTLVRPAGLIVRTAVLLTPLYLAQIVALTVAGTAWVGSSKLPVVEP